MKRSVFAIVLLSTAPAMAQGITNGRDTGGNLSRDKGASASAIQPQATVSSAVNQSRRPVPPLPVKKPR